MTTNELLAYWVVYLTCAGLFYFWFWWVTRAKYTLMSKLWWLVSLLRILGFVLLFTPAEQAAGTGLYAPAWIVVAFDTLQGMEGGWLRAGVNLLITLLAGALLYFFHLIFRLVQSVAQKRSKATQ